jgi:FkbM family methyltransferase
LPPPDPSVGDNAPLARMRGHRLVDSCLLAYARTVEHPSKIRILKWLIHGLAGGRIEVRHAGGAVVAVDPDDYVGWHIFKTGHYEPASVALACRIMGAQPGLFVDVGAHFGWYSLAIAPMAGATVIAIEPDSANCSALRTYIARNRLRNVSICNTAVGPVPALLAMSRRALGNSGTFAVHAGEAACSAERHWVAATTLQTLLKTLVRPPARPVLLKIDIEGFEPQALAGLDFDGPFRPKNILMEYEPQLHPRGWGTLGEVTSFFSARGYALRDVFGCPVGERSILPEANLWACDARERGALP